MHHISTEAVCFDRRLIQTIYRPMPFWTQPKLTLGTLTSAFTGPFWRQSYIIMSYGNNAKVEGLNIMLDDPADCTQTDPGE